MVVQDDQCFVEMEYLPWETLKSQVGQVPDAVVPTLLAQLVGAVRFLEDKSVVHHDIKPENILVAPDFSSLKLIDLSCASSNPVLPASFVVLSCRFALGRGIS